MRVNSSPLIGGSDAQLHTYIKRNTMGAVPIRRTSSATALREAAKAAKPAPRPSTHTNGRAQEGYVPVPDTLLIPIRLRLKKKRFAEPAPEDGLRARFRRLLRRKKGSKKGKDENPTDTPTVEQIKATETPVVETWESKYKSLSVNKRDLVEEVEREIKRMETEFEDTAAGLVVLKRAQDATKVRIDIADEKSVHKMVESACCGDRNDVSESHSARNSRGHSMKKSLF